MLSNIISAKVSILSSSVLWSQYACCRLQNFFNGQLPLSLTPLILPKDRVLEQILLESVSQSGVNVIVNSHTRSGDNNTFIDAILDNETVYK